MISFDSTRGGVSEVTVRGAVTASYLLIQRARPSDSGRYSCQPAGAAQQSLRVHVLQGQTFGRSLISTAKSSPACYSGLEFSVGRPAVAWNGRLCLIT